MTAAINRWVLILEDEKDLKDLMADELTKAGFRVIATAKAAEAISILRNQKFCCILMDMRLEGGTGSQVIFSVRESKNLNFVTPILVASGQLNADLVLKIKDLVNGVFVKPFDLNSLIAKVNSVCMIET